MLPKFYLCFYHFFPLHFLKLSNLIIKELHLSNLQAKNDLIHIYDYINYVLFFIFFLKIKEMHLSISNNFSFFYFH